MILTDLLGNTHYEHSHKVSKISELMAAKAGLPNAELQIVSQAALFHDIGKASIPSKILNKPSALTTAEFDIVKTHTAMGCMQITEAIQVLSTASLIAQQHHEHENGNGYYHLTSDCIHPYAKLVAVADVFDALYSKRSYKEPWNIERIIDYFNEKAGKQFDGGTVLLLFSVLDTILALYL